MFEYFYFLVFFLGLALEIVSGLATEQVVSLKYKKRFALISLAPMANALTKHKFVMAVLPVAVVMDLMNKIVNHINVWMVM